MLHWPTRIKEWRTVLALKGVKVSAVSMLRAILSGPVDRSVWRPRMRKCGKCPIGSRRLLRDENGVLTWTGLHACRREHTLGQILGCGCNTTLLALTAAPYERGCWARQITKNEGWASLHYPSRWAKVKAVMKFVMNLK